MLIQSPIPLQQTSPTMFVISMIAVFIFILIIIIVGTSAEKKEVRQKENWLHNNSDKLKIQDDFLLKFISPLSKLTPKCNKCYNNVYNLWEIADFQLTIRCNDCKKKYYIDLNENSNIPIDSFSEYIDFVQNSYSQPNEKLRDYLINHIIYDFSLLRSNQPIIRAIRFLTHSEEVATSSRLNFKLIGYTDSRSFNENEYFEKDNIELKDVHKLLGEYDEKSLVLKAFDENPTADKITVQIPSLIFGVQKVLTVYRNGIPKELALKKNSISEKKSRRISQATKDKVWRRDEGKCVECGSNEKLEFDHIIPFSKGGSNTYRNIQLLCEKCNRSKSDKIG